MYLENALHPARERTPRPARRRRSGLRFGAGLALMLATALAGGAGPGPDGAAALAPPVEAAPAASGTADCPLLLRQTFRRLQTGKPQSLCQYQGKVLVVVNTASYCGYTHQYESLEALYRKYRERGLVVLGFPSNDYGAQEPGSNREIAEFCRTTYGVEFPMFEKAEGIRVAANPLYVELVARTGEAPRWNFHKYLVNRSGQHIQSFGSGVEPGERQFVAAIERLLAEPPPR